MNSVGTAYSEQISVLTLALATIADVTSSDITGVSFKVSSSITANGGAEVTEKGFCYSTTENPTIEDSKKTVDEFETTIEGLIGGTTYYVRAYAVNSVGTAYSEQISVTTLTTIAKIGDITGFNITGTSFEVASEIIANGGSEVTEKGFCYSTTENPTVDDNKYVVEGDDFETTIAGLANGTTCYIRAYAVNTVGTAYSEQIAVTTLVGVVNGVFTVSDSGKKVCFSSGNLQYNAAQGTHECADGTTKQGTWRFAENQWDYVGDANINISSTYDDWIDLFGWGTSGYNDKFPYMTSLNINYIDYGDGSNDIAGTNYDWGVYNAISNGGNQAGQWRTLTIAEWQYLINSRANASSKKGVATVDNVPGVVLLPDDWTLPSGLTFIKGSNGSFAQNTYSIDDWVKMEANGAVFLPAAGYRDGSDDVRNVGSYGYYWSSSAQYSNYAHRLYFYSRVADGFETQDRRVGQSIRLVTDAN